MGDLAARNETVTGSLTTSGNVTESGTTSVTGTETVSGAFTVSNTLGVQFTGTQPAKGADPGANNIAIGTNQAKAWGYLTSDGLGGVSCVDGVNVASVALAGSNRGWTITFARGMGSSSFSVEATYRIQSGIHDSSTCWVPKAVISSSGGFDLLLQKSSTEAYVDASAAVVAVSFVVFGRQ